MDDIIEVAIIGCGISGIAASNILCQNEIQHVIVEAQGCVGGRIAGTILDGVSIDLGAMMVHHPEENNPIRELMDKMKIKYSSKNYNSQQIMVGLQKEIDNQTKNLTFQIYKNLLQQIEALASKSINDISIQQAIKQCMDIKGYQLNQQSKEYLQLLIQIHANIQGADLSQISSKFLYFDNPQDVIPEGGYYHFIQKLYQMYPRNVYFQHRVELIVYREDKEYIQITTDKKVFRAKNLISSIPLGCLKRNTVKFIPPLSSEKQKAIQNIGFGVFNKVIVSFQTAFWDTSKQYILLVSKNPSKQGFFRIRATIVKQTNILWAFISGSKSKQLSKMDDEAIVKQFIDVLSLYYPIQQIKVKNYVVTRWNQNKLFNGSYSYFKVGSTTIEDFQEMKRPVEERIWFVGEHCTTDQISTVHGAYKSGIQAAKSILQKISKKQNPHPKQLP